MQEYWTRKAEENGILAERDLNKYLADYLLRPTARRAKPERK